MRLLASLISLALLLVGVVAVVAVGVFSHYAKDLPDYAYLKDYQPPTLSRIYAGQHFRTDEVAGEQLGNQVSSYVLQKILLPTRPGQSK